MCLSATLGILSLVAEDILDEDETLEEIKPVKRRRRLKKPALVGIILAGVLAVGCVAWVVIQRYFPSLTIGILSFSISSLNVFI